MNERTESEAPENDVEETQSTDAPAAETRDEEMERLRATAEAADKRVLMAQAEAENARKRIRRDFEDRLKFALVPLVADLLEVRDNLNRAIEASGATEETSGLHDGVVMVAKQLDDTLAKYGVQEIPAQDETFDPNIHEAISQMPNEAPSGTITHVAAPGFQLHDRVVRPSQVVVSSGPAE